MRIIKNVTFFFIIEKLKSLNTIIPNLIYSNF
jgi:hypothetical protein